MKKLLLNYKFSNIPKLQHINPYTHQLFAQKSYISDSQLFNKVVQTSKAQQKWKKYELAKRKSLIHKFVQQILNQKSNKYQQIAKSIGKCRKDIDIQYQRLSSIYQKLINCADDALKQVVLEDSNRKLIKYIKQPIGIVLLFPFYSQPIFDTLLKIIPALVAGNTALIKASPYCPLIGEYFQNKLKQITQLQILSDIFIDNTQTERLFQFRQIQQITFSGSISSGRHIFQLVAKQRMIDANFFYGAKDAAYIDQTANIDQIINQVVRSAFYNCGQSFDSLKRLFIHKDKQQQTLVKLVETVQKYKIGDPLNSQTDIGPICIQQSISDIQALINEAIINGAQCLIGGTITTDSISKGNFVEPTILNYCESNMSITQTQVTGPILCCTIVQNEQQFINQLNQNIFGVGTKIFTKDIKKYQKLIKKMEVGRISFNSNEYISQNLAIQSRKKSGKGRILGNQAYEQFIRFKSIYIQK